MPIKTTWVSSWISAGANQNSKYTYQLIGFNWTNCPFSISSHFMVQILVKCLNFHKNWRTTRPPWPHHWGHMYRIQPAVHHRRGHETLPVGTSHRGGHQLHRFASRFSFWVGWSQFWEWPKKSNLPNRNVITVNISRLYVMSVFFWRHSSHFAFFWLFFAADGGHRLVKLLYNVVYNYNLHCLTTSSGSYAVCFLYTGVYSWNVLKLIESWAIFGWVCQLKDGLYTLYRLQEVSG